MKTCTVKETITLTVEKGSTVIISEEQYLLAKKKLTVQRGLSLQPEGVEENGNDNNNP